MKQSYRRHTLKNPPLLHWGIQRTRRAFLQCLALLGSLPFAPKRAWAKKYAIALSKLPALQKVKGHVVVNIKNTNVLLVRDSQNSIKAINPQCTHKKCEVHYKPEINALGCKCHKSRFGLDGNVQGGPAPKPLTTYPVQLDDEKIIVSIPTSPAA